MLAACSTSSGGDVRAGDGGAGAPPAIDGGNHQAASGQGFGAGPDGGGDGPLGGGGSPGSGPSVIQSLFDYSQPGLAPWGPVEQSFNVTVGGQTYSVNKLAHYDPFIGKYQLANGDIVMTNEPLESVVVMSANQPDPPLPPAEAWTAPWGQVEVFSNQIQVDFDQTVTDQQVWQLMAEKELHFIFSSFEPPDPDQPGTQNSNAWFWFEYKPSVFANFQAAYTYFLAYPHVGEVQPNVVAGYSLDYAPVNGSGTPGDYWYSHPIQQFGVAYETRQIQALGINTSDRLNMGPPYGTAQVSNIGVAVIDSGVQRYHPDFAISGSANRKISWAGVTCGDKSFFFGRNWGDVSAEDTGENRKNRHGTSCAGTITATTSDLQHGGNSTGVPSCAPECGVFPIAVRMTGNSSFSSASLGVALAFMKDSLKNGYFLEDLRAVSMSWGSLQYTGFYEKMIIRDLKDSDRLYLASAGNIYTGSEVTGNQVQYPAGFADVMGISGIWAFWNPDSLTTTYFGRSSANEGSNYLEDANLNPLLREYPVSGIYGTVGSGGDRRDESRVTSTQVYGGPPDTLYEAFRGTSFACPQVAGLAALLYDQYPSKTRAQVRDRIINTRNAALESNPAFSDYELAGPVRFHNALAAGW